MEGGGRYTKVAHLHVKYMTKTMHTIRTAAKKFVALHSGGVVSDSKSITREVTYSRRKASANEQCQCARMQRT